MLKKQKLTCPLFGKISISSISLLLRLELNTSSTVSHKYDRNIQQPKRKNDSNPLITSPRFSRMNKHLQAHYE